MRPSLVIHDSSVKTLVSEDKVAILNFVMLVRIAAFNGN